MNIYSPAVEVFIPVYNDILNIERAVLSCLNQKNIDLRVIVSDNQSTDGTFEKLEALAASDSRLVLVRNDKNIGMMPNIIRYVDLVKASYFMFLCSDDFLCDDTALSQAFTMINHSNDIQSVYCNLKFVDHDGRQFAKNIFKRERVFNAEDAFKQSIISLRNKFGIALLHRTAIARQYPYPADGTYTADFWQSYKIGCHGVCGHIDKIMIANSYTGENATNTVMFQALKQTKTLQKAEGIELTSWENARQKVNYVWVTAQKIIALKVLLPVFRHLKRKG